MGSLLPGPWLVQSIDSFLSPFIAAEQNTSQPCPVPGEGGLSARRVQSSPGSRTRTYLTGPTGSPSRAKLFETSQESQGTNGVSHQLEICAFVSRHDAHDGATKHYVFPSFPGIRRVQTSRRPEYALIDHGVRITAHGNKKQHEVLRSADTACTRVRLSCLTKLSRAPHIRRTCKK